MDMPHKPLKPCKYPGCPNLTDGTYCEKHKAEAAKEYNTYERAPNHNKKYGREWKRIRDKYVKKHPLCERCLKEGRITPVEEVHHILPVNRGGTNAESNLMSVCRSCHNKIHIELGDRHPSER
jgi:5-methylcytosine-specific restriction protein A